MVPLRLFIKNFLSYGNTTQCIDFTPYHLICLSGKNGHGKSALLDALTWTVWGHARKVQTATRADEGLMRLGQTTMTTSLDLACKDTAYRIRREYAIHQGKPQHTLDFGIIDPHTQQVKSLNEKTVRGTQEKIISTIGLDYDGFINSVFLRQGASNEFSKKAPKDRKEILCSMLGINHFETIKKRAQEKARALSTQHDLVRSVHQRLTLDVQEKEPLKQHLEQVTTLQQDMFAQQTALQATHAKLQEHLQTYHAHQHQHTSMGNQLGTLEQQRTAGVAELRQERVAWKTALKKRSTVQRQETVHTREHIEQELAQLAEIEAHEHTVKAQLRATYQARSEIVQQLFSLRDELMRTYSAQKQQLEAQRNHVIHPALFEKYKESYHRWVATRNQLRVTYEQQHHQLMLLEQHSSTCPTCDKTLAAPEKAFLHHKLSAQHKHTAHQAERLNQLLPILKQKLVKAHELLAVYENAQKLEAQLAQHEQESLRAVQERDRAHRELDALEKQLAAISTGRMGRKKELEAQRDHLLSCTGDQETIQTLCNQALRIVRTRIAHLRDLKQTFTQLTQHYAQLAQHIQAAHTLVQEEIGIKNRLHECQQKLQDLYQQKGILEEKIAQKVAQEKELAQHEQQMGSIALQLQQYTIISQAVSKDGLQALLIEQAIPEIEQEANYLLEKLTDNQAHVSIESLRDLKSGKTKETLDINISDSSGIRAYELFSGGEAFRIDFALRIALSKLLARRAGTSLQTLIIDEGFGSQDEEGLAHMLDALYKIQDDFAKIIIVSHLPFMKDHFPVHFVVSKSASGSSIKVIEQG